MAASSFVLFCFRWLQRHHCFGQYHVCHNWFVKKIQLKCKTQPIDLNVQIVFYNFCQLLFIRKILFKRKNEQKNDLNRKSYWNWKMTKMKRWPKNWFTKKTQLKCKTQPIDLNVQLVFYNFCQLLFIKKILFKWKNEQKNDLNRKSYWNWKMTKMKRCRIFQCIFFLIGSIFF